MIKKPRLSLGNNEDKEVKVKNPRLKIKNDSDSKVTGTRSTASVAVEGIGQLIKTILFFAVFGVILLGVLYSALAATLMFTAPHNDSSTERVWVARGAFPGGQVPADSYVYGSASGPATNSLLEKAGEGYIGTPDYFIAKVIAGPFGSVSNTKDGIIVVDGKNTKYKGKVADQILNKNYLAICEEGSCVKGEVITVPQENITGEARGVVDITKFTFDTYSNSLELGVTDAK